MAEDDGIARRPTDERGRHRPVAPVRRSERPRGPAPARDVDYTRGPRGQQYLCSACGMRPCLDSCTEQFCPDSLHRKMSRAGVGLPGRLTPADWALTHAEWLAGVVAGTVDVHAALRAEVQEFVDRLMVPAAFGVRRSAFGESVDAEPTALTEDQSPNAERRTPTQRSIPVAAAMEQAMAVMAGRVPAEDVAPVYERRS